jgi:formate C-acetyltransferase
MSKNVCPDPEVLHRMKEHFAAGYFEMPEASPMRRWSQAVRRRFEWRQLHPHAGQALYPCGRAHLDGENAILCPSYSFTYGYNDRALTERLAAANGEESATLSAVQSAIRDLGERLSKIKTVHTVGGRGYTHSIPNYGRVLREGLNGHAARIARGLEAERRFGNQEKVDFYLGLQDVLEGVRRWHERILEYLDTLPMDSPEAESLRTKLLAALKQVPFRPARTFYEAMVAYNFVFYLDDGDNPGRVDQELFPYYAHDLSEGRISHEEAVRLVRQLWANTDANDGWSAAIGGTTSTGEPGYNEMTLVCLEAARRIRRPNLQLHIRHDMPQAVWDAAFDTIATGCGIPALYSEEEFLRGLREAHLGVREEDIGWYNGGGCTETMIHGLSNVGSLDAGINLPLILAGTLDRRLASAASFEDLVEEYRKDVAAAVSEIGAEVSADQEVKARLRPQPMRSLLIDDCIDRGLEYNAGGARYNWSVVNVAGLANVIDSLAAVREVVFRRKEKTGAELREMLRGNFQGEEAFRRRLEQCPRFGNDQPGSDDIAGDIGGFVFREFLRYAPWRGGKFLASCLMFTTYCQAGEPVGATPDGRRAGDPLADSAGPYQGRDVHGPTAMLKSVAAMPHYLAPGTLCVNVRFSMDFFRTEDGRRNLQGLVRTYFKLGGAQLQVNVVDQQVLRDAIAHPERHRDLIVRVGGYSEYFHRLSPDLQQTVLDRTEHAMGVASTPGRVAGSRAFRSLSDPR